MTVQTGPRPRTTGVHPRLEPTRYQSARPISAAAPTSPVVVTTPISWVLRGEFEEEVASEE